MMLDIFLAVTVDTKDIYSIGLLSWYGIFLYAIRDTVQVCIL